MPGPSCGKCFTTIALSSANALGILFGKVVANVSIIYQLREQIIQEIKENLVAPHSQEKIRRKTALAVLCGMCCCGIKTGSLGAVQMGDPYLAKHITNTPG